ncbi:serine/threonine-protein kinase [Nocardioides ferulae]|uniref:serine/threonine-protein kinase n=1 Tax=Nocardioides ferulae TaxID=2340821 RepID=UPI000EAFD798|nr:serine/threonine-protein kinase [Nocardioides ferulae]
MPSRLGRYAVRRRIGSGAFATVWLAYDAQLDSPVAVKVLADNWTEDLHVRRRFVEEGRYLRRVESPHVVSVYDAGELDDGRPYLVMSYADQGTLADRLELEGLTAAQALEVVRQVGAGLTALHERDILHRDVKPANVLFRTLGNGRSGRSDGTAPAVRAMLGDLGLGKALDMSSRLTMVAGTPSYIAPEQARGEALDARADLYSLAALAYLLLAGRAAYSHADLGAAADPPPVPPLSSDERSFPAEVEEVLRRGLARDRDDRWPDVASFVAALEVALAPVLEQDTGELTWAAGASPDPWLTQAGGAPSLPMLGAAADRPGEPEAQPEPPGPPSPSRRRWLRRATWALAAAVVVAGGAAVGWGLHDGGSAQTELSDDTGSISVTVPPSWTVATSTEGWRPPDADRDFQALSAGTTADWAEGELGEGVFLGLLPGDDLPETLPQHPECAETGLPVDDVSGSARTVWSLDCPAGVTVERVVQVTADHLLWVQVRSSDRAEAARVLDTVAVHGM